MPDFEDVLDGEGPGVTATDEFDGPAFSAKAFIFRPQPHSPPWARFLREGFPDVVVGRSSAPSALLVVKVATRKTSTSDLMFAFAFGPSGRFLMRSESFTRGYGLRTALNLIYPRSSVAGARLRAVDSKRRGETILRSRMQSSGQAEFEMFDVNRLQDVLGKAVGVPADSQWGARVSGGDPLALNLDLNFTELGRLCRNIEDAHLQNDYADRFGWIDNIQPVLDPQFLTVLQNQVLERFRNRAFDDLQLAPPEIVDWDRVAAFRYHFDRRSRHGGAVLHPDLRLQDYVAGLSRTRDLDSLEVEDLRRATVYAVDADEQQGAKWSIWRCLVGELQLNEGTYLLDEGEFFAVRPDYMKELDTAIDQVPKGTVSLPGTTAFTVEGAYNETAARESDLLLLDKRTVRVPGRTTAVEICDLLSADKQLVHVKRHLGSSDLSHLFAQGLVSAELLQSSVDFRKAARERIREVAGARQEFDFIAETSVVTTEFEVVYAIAERWNGRSLTEALPFFSKVNLREVVNNLTSRGFRVALQQIPVEGR